MTLLHELAHWVAPRSPERRGRRRRVAHHDRAFYAVALGLYERHGLAMPDALAREAARYPSALRHAVALGIPGAAEALASRRSALRSHRGGAWHVLVAEHPVVVRREGRWWVCATCRHRIVGRLLVRARRRAGRERHVLWTREPMAAEVV